MGKIGIAVTCLGAGVMLSGTGWTQPTASAEGAATAATVFCRGPVDYDYDVGDAGRGTLVLHAARGDAAGAHGAALAPGTCAYADGRLPGDGAIALRSEEPAPGASVFDALFPCLGNAACVAEVRAQPPADPAVLWFDPRQVQVRFPPAAPPSIEPPSATPPSATPSIAPPAQAKPVIALPGQLTRLSGELGTFHIEHDGDLPATIAAKICIDASGDVTHVDVLSKVSDDLRDQLVARLETFRYAPFVQDGVAVPACVAETFRTEQLDTSR